MINKTLQSLKINSLVESDTSLQLLGNIFSLGVTAQHWSKIVSILRAEEYRFAGLWAEDQNEFMQLNCCFASQSEYLLLHTEIPLTNLRIASITPYYIAANRFERSSRDMFGIEFVGTSDKRRWIRHKAWRDWQFPLRKNFPVAPTFVEVTPANVEYHFFKASGSGIYEIPVGPVHAGIIEPGHFRFQVAGEEVIRLEERLGYVHKGIEKIAEGRDVFGLLKLAARVSGDSTIAHSWAASLACENALKVNVPERAIFLRAILAERERVANHLNDFAAISNDVGYTFAFYQLMRLKELWLRTNKQIFGHRLLMDLIIPGGVLVDVDERAKTIIKTQIQELEKELTELYPIFEDNSSYHDRLKNTGILSFAQAKHFGVLGYMARASGLNFDMRDAIPYSPYDKVKVHLPLFTNGDVLSRVRVRAQEILISFELINKFLDMLPQGQLQSKWQNRGVEVTGIGLVEGWRGETLAYVKIGSDGLIERYFPRDPSWFSWPALEELIHGNIVPDFPVCNKSVNGSYSGVDL